MSTPAQRFLAIFILSLWMAVMAGPSAVGLHLALAPHHAHDHHDHEPLAELAHEASHGHDHAETVPGHEHEAVVDDSPIRRPSAAAAGQGAFLAARAGETPASRPGAALHPPRPSGPATPLFRAHCSLLL